MTDTLINLQAGSDTAPLRAKWGWIVALGVIYLIVGFIALGSVVKPARTDQHPMQPAVKYIELYLGCRIQCESPDLVYSTTALQLMDSRRFYSLKQNKDHRETTQATTVRVDCNIPDPGLSF